MINYDDVKKGKHNENNSNLPYIPDHPYRMLVIGGSWSGKANALLNLKKRQDEMIIIMSVIDKIYLYVKDQIK